MISDVDDEDVTTDQIILLEGCESLFEQVVAAGIPWY